MNSIDHKEKSDIDQQIKFARFFGLPFLTFLIGIFVGGSVVGRDGMTNQEVHLVMETLQRTRGRVAETLQLKEADLDPGILLEKDPKDGSISQKACLSLDENKDGKLDTLLTADFEVRSGGQGFSFASVGDFSQR